MSNTTTEILLPWSYSNDSELGTYVLYLRRVHEPHEGIQNVCLLCIYIPYFVNYQYE